MRRAALALVAAAVLTARGAVTVGMPLPEPKYRVFRPDGPGPHAAVVFLPGCEGFAPPLAPTVYERRAERLRTLGHVVVFADFLGRRALKTCAGPVTHEDAARDLGEAVEWLRTQPGVDPARIAAMGWSYGGRAVLVALAGDRAAALSRAVVFYPDCRALPPWKASLPLLMLLGGDDDMTPAKLCQEAASRSAVPAAAKVLVFPGALHGFDIPDLPAKKRYGFATIGYHREAATAAQKEVEEFLRTPPRSR